MKANKAVLAAAYERSRTMKAKAIVAIVAVLAWNGITFAGYPETRTVLLGDLNQTYGGPGSVDHVYVNPGLAKYIEDGYSSAIPFDVIDDNREVPHTFQLDVGPGEVIVGATLTYSLRGSHSMVNGDWLVLHSDHGTAHWGGDNAGVYEYDTIGWLPIPTDQYVERSVDLANIRGDNRLPWLADGELNIHITDDTAVSWARLDYTVTPEPASLSLVALGGLAMLRRHRKGAER